MFKDGGDFQKNFDTSAGPITVLAEVHVFGRHLVLDELLFYPKDYPGKRLIGVTYVLLIRRALLNLAKEEGFAELTVGFHRTGARRHGRTISFTRRLE